MRIDRVKLTIELMRRDMTQARLAELAGVSRITVSAIKRGKTCSDEVGRKIAQALGIAIEDITVEQEEIR